MIYQIRHRTHLEDIIYAVNLYFDGLSLRKTSKALSQFVKKSYCNKGLDSKVSTPEVIIKDKENQRIHCR